MFRRCSRSPRRRVGSFADRDDLEPLADVLAAVADDESGVDRPELRRRRSSDRIARVLLAPHRPTVIVIGDVHWDDGVGLLTIGHLARTIEESGHRLVRRRPCAPPTGWRRSTAEVGCVVNVSGLVRDRAR